MPAFQHQPLFEHAHHDDTPWRRLASDHVCVERIRGEDVVVVDTAALSMLADRAMRDIAHLLRPGHLAQLARILEDEEASDNDRFVALELLKNACVAAGFV